MQRYTTLGAFPTTRMRRNRRTDWSRRLVAETRLSADDLIWPVFVQEGRRKRTPVKSMPGIDRLSVDLLVEATRRARDLGIPAIAIFPEGPYSVNGRLEPGLPGVGLLALRSGVPVVPAGIHGTYAALVGRRAYVPRRHPLAVRFGKPLRFIRSRQRATQGLRADVTGGIMEEIAALLAADGSRASAAVPR